MAEGQSVRTTLVAVMNEYAGRPGFFQTRSIIAEVASRLDIRGGPREQELLTAWADMFRLGLVAPGFNLSNPDLPHCHLTDRGVATLANASRDPANPEGYRAALRTRGTPSDVVAAYVDEALTAYNATCFKAAAVMIGCASESGLLELRDAVVGRVRVHGRKPAKGIEDWRAKTVLDAIAVELSGHTSAMPVKLREAFQYYWPAFLQQIRAARNDAGHPASIAPVTAEAVHGALLIFPELFALTGDLIAWVASAMP